MRAALLYKYIVAILAAIVAVLAIGVVSGRCASVHAADELPRYKLKVGQQIDYQENSEFKFKSGVFNEDNEWTFWVVRQNDEGNWRVVLREDLGRKIRELLTAGKETAAKE